MTDEQRQEIMRRQAHGARAMSQEDMDAREIQQREGMQNAALSSNEHQDAMRNFWGATADAQNNIIPDPPQPTLWERFKHWIRA